MNRFKFYIAFARNAFREARHNKVLHIAAGFAAALILFSLFMGEVSMYQNEKVVKDVGLAAISLLGVFVAIYLGVTSLYQELEKRTIYSIVSKPIRREDVLIGKYLGMAWILGVAVVMMTLYLYLVTSFIEAKIDFALLPAIALIYVELLVIAAVAVLFSSFSTPFMSGFFTLGFFLVGRVSHILRDFGERSKNDVFKFFANLVQKVIDLEPFDLRVHAVHKLPIYMEDFWYPLFYGCVLTALLIAGSLVVFRRRDFK